MVFWIVQSKTINKYFVIQSSKITSLNGFKTTTVLYCINYDLFQFFSRVGLWRVELMNNGKSRDTGGGSNCHAVNPPRNNPKSFQLRTAISWSNQPF